MEILPKLPILPQTSQSSSTFAMRPPSSKLSWIKTKKLTLFMLTIMSELAFQSILALLTDVALELN